LLSDFRTLT